MNKGFKKNFMKFKELISRYLVNIILGLRGHWAMLPRGRSERGDPGPLTRPVRDVWTRSGSESGKLFYIHLNYAHAKLKYLVLCSPCLMDFKVCAHKTEIPLSLLSLADISVWWMFGTWWFPVNLGEARRVQIGSIWKSANPSRSQAVVRIRKFWSDPGF